MTIRIPSSGNPFKPPQEVLDQELLYKAIFEPIRLEDKFHGNEFLKRFLSRPEEWRRTIINKVAALWDNHSPINCPVDLLTYLKDIVGFDSDFDYLTLRLSENNLRKLILLAVPLWKERFSEKGLRNVIRLLVGRDIVYYNWFDWRAIIGETILAEDQIGYDFWLLGGSASIYDEYYSQIRVVDDGTLDRQLLVDLVGLERVSSERMEVAILDFLDYFDGTRDKWTTLSGTPAVIEDRTFKIPGNSIEQPTVTGSPLGPDYVVISKFKFDPVLSAYELFFFYNYSSNIGYYVSVSPTQIQLIKSDGGFTVLATSTFPVEDEVWYKLRTHISEEHSTGDYRIKVYIDGSEIFNVSDSTPPITQGEIFLQAVGGLGVLWIDNFEVYRVPLRLAEIGPGDVVYSPNFFDP